MSLPHRYHVSPQQISSELMLIEAAKQDARHFAPLYEKYYKPIFLYLYQRMNDKDSAFDLTAQVFLKALQNIGRFEFKGVPFSSWLFRIAHNELMQMFRNNKNTRTVNIDLADIKDLFERMEEPWFMDYLPKVKLLLKDLNEEELSLIEMRFFEKRPFKEIAEILMMTENNAKVKLHRILERLKKRLTGSSTK